MLLSLFLYPHIHPARLPVPPVAQGKEKVVLLTLEPDWEKMKTRMSVVEHPFGTVKWYHGAHYLLCRGREKAGAEIGLSLLVYNLKRAIKLKGFHRC